MRAKSYAFLENRSAATCRWDISGGVRYYFQANFLCGYGVNLCYEGRSYILFDLVGFPLIMAGAIIIIVEKTTRKDHRRGRQSKRGFKT